MQDNYLPLHTGNLRIIVLYGNVHGNLYWQTNDFFKNISHFKTCNDLIADSEHVYIGMIMNLDF